MIQIKVFPPRSLDTRALMMDDWPDLWVVYVFLSVNGIPWETSLSQAEKRKAGHYPTPHNLCIVGVGDISSFPFWLSEFIKTNHFTKLSFSYTEVPTYVILEKNLKDIYLRYEYDEYYVPSPVHPHFSTSINLQELADQILLILPTTEHILKDMGQEEVLQTTYWKRYVKRYFLNLDDSFRKLTG